MALAFMLYFFLYFNPPIAKQLQTKYHASHEKEIKQNAIVVFASKARRYGDYGGITQAWRYGEGGGDTQAWRCGSGSGSGNAQA